MNAFDVVRLHKFGDKDARAAEGTEPGKLPSFKAMQDFASADEEVKNTLARERQELAVKLLNQLNTKQPLLLETEL